jgi:exo-beta-1,3-glucanase (GH17 family)
VNAPTHRFLTTGSGLTALSEHFTTANMRKQLSAVLNRYPQHAWKVRITETGWPSEGTPAAHSTAMVTHKQVWMNS